MSRTGHGAYIAIGEETTYGTPVPRTHWLRTAEAMSIGREIEREVVRPLGIPGEVAHGPEEMYTVADNVGGSLTVLLGWEDGTPLLLKHMFGSVASTGSGPYQHQYEFDALPSIDPSLTIEQVYGSYGPASRAEAFAGCVISPWEISTESGGKLTATLEIIGKSSAGLVAPSAATFFSGGGWFYHNHLATATFDGDAIGSIKSLSIRGNRMLTRQAELGSLTTGRPLPDGLLEVEVEIVTRWDNNDAYADYLTGTTGKLVLTFNNGGGKVLGFTAGAAQIVNYTKPVSAAGPVDITLTFRCKSTSSNAAIIAVLTNAQATVDVAA